MHVKDLAFTILETTFTGVLHTLPMKHWAVGILRPRSNVAKFMLTYVHEPVKHCESKGKKKHSSRKVMH